MGLQSINFGYDAYVLDGKAKEILKANSQILKDKASAKIQVEGHCDQRGGIQYNVALGEKRANSVKKFLVEQGVSADRISVISFGKEKLLDQGTTEEAYARNRRANFVVTAR
jgi:peptidoglycan-associated lipoprotein